MALAADSFAGRLVAVISRRSPAFRRPTAARSSFSASPATAEPAERGELHDLKPKRTHFRLAKNTYELLLEDHRADELVFERLKASASALAAPERMDNRATLHTLKKAFADFALLLEPLTNLPLNIFASSWQVKERRRAAHSAAASSEATAAVFERVNLPLVDVRRSMELRTFSTVLSQVVESIRFHSRECALLLDGPVYMGSAPRLETVRLTISRLQASLEAVITLLDEVADDYSGADLREADLESANLSWLRWDEGTRWPLTWESQIRRMSIEVSPGHWVVQPIGADENLDLMV